MLYGCLEAISDLALQNYKVIIGTFTNCFITYFRIFERDDTIRLRPITEQASGIMYGLAQNGFGNIAVANLITTLCSDRIT